MLKGKYRIMTTCIDWELENNGDLSLPIQNPNDDHLPSLKMKLND
jgi:hypothetical protein